CHPSRQSFLTLAGPHPRSPRSRLRARSSRRRCARAYPEQNVADAVLARLKPHATLQRGSASLSGERPCAADFQASVRVAVAINLVARGGVSLSAAATSAAASRPSTIT